MGGAKRYRFDLILVTLIALIIVFGTIVFISASWGLMAREGARFSGVMFNHFAGLVLGVVLLFVAMRIPMTQYKKYSLYVYIAGVISLLLVFLPIIGFEYGGAKRWIMIGPLTIQPAEFMKIGFILYLAAFLSSARSHVTTFSKGALPSLVIASIPVFLLLLQPDTGTVGILLITAVAMFIGAGGRWRYVVASVVLISMMVGLLVVTRPYVKERFLTFLDPSREALGAGYQIKQSLIAIGSGGLYGRGFGHSVQKFGYLPEPIGDSIFAVMAEEFGFIGGTGFVLLLLLFSLRGVHISRAAPTRFSGLVVLGIVILIVSQSLVNISSMMGLIPLTGMPLLLVSHGGTSIVFTMFALGIMLNVSKHRRV